MEINKIRQAVNSGLPNEVVRRLILRVIADDEKAIPDILEILDEERAINRQLLLDTNLELSRAFMTLEDPNIGKKKPKPIIELGFVTGEIRKHYLKWQDRIKCCFKMEGLP